MTILDIINERQLTEILHFTTDAGVLGALRTGFLIPSRELNQEEQIEFILKHNCRVRKDPAWTGHNSLSITAINTRFFEFSRAQHVSQIPIWWCILSFDPAILAHANVMFCTGNNTWPKSTRTAGPAGLEALFASSVPGSFGTTIVRNRRAAPNLPTCDQAEVLYPGKLSISHLTGIYVEQQDHADQLGAWFSVVRADLSEHLVKIQPHRFTGTSSV